MAIMRPMVFGVCLFFLALICAALGIIWIIFASLATETVAYRYDNVCEHNHKCTFRFEVEEKMEKPVYLYYRMENYYQGYRRYVSSRSDRQLRGDLGVDVNNYETLGACDSRISEDDEENEPSAVFLPCGLIAYSYFNDSFIMTDDSGRKLDQSSKDVALSTDDSLFKDPGADTEGIRVVDSFENPLFKVWMRVAALPDFLKLYAIIDEDIEPGVYRMEVKNRYPVRDYEARKYFKLATTTWIGGRSFYLGIASLCICVLLLIVSLFICLKSTLWPRKLGNIAYLDWDNQ